MFGYLAVGGRSHAGVSGEVRVMRSVVDGTPDWMTFSNDDLIDLYKTWECHSAARTHVARVPCEAGVRHFDMHVPSAGEDFLFEVICARHKSGEPIVVLEQVGRVVPLFFEFVVFGVERTCAEAVFNAFSRCIIEEVQAQDLELGEVIAERCRTQELEFGVAYAHAAGGPGVPISRCRWVFPSIIVRWEVARKSLQALRRAASGMRIPPEFKESSDLNVWTRMIPDLFPMSGSRLFYSMCSDMMGGRQQRLRWVPHSITTVHGKKKKAERAAGADEASLEFFSLRR